MKTRRGIALLLVVGCVLSICLAGCGPDAATKAAIEKIDSIGTVTLDSESAIRDAREAYDDLTEQQKSNVKNEDDLVAAEEAFGELKDAEQASATIALISGLGEITADSEANVEAARASYDALSANAKAKVTNYQVLKNAEKKIANIKAQQNSNRASSSSSTSSSSTSTNSNRQKCPICNGTGRVKYYAGGEGSDYTYGPCTDCNGRGYV